MTHSLARYVRDCDIASYEQLGWFTKSYHAQRGEHEIFLMVWMCGCAPVDFKPIPPLHMGKEG